MQSHSLKVWPSQFAALLTGEKRHEWRRNDRDFRIGDELELYEFDPHPNRCEDGYTGRKWMCRITYLSENFGVPDGWCVLSISQGNLVFDCPWCGHEGQPKVVEDEEEGPQLGCSNPKECAYIFPDSTRG